MNKIGRRKALLAHGYFPKELPPPFSTTSFARKARTIAAAWSTAAAQLPRRQQVNHPRPSVPSVFDMARRGHARRSLSIPNPVNQFYVCECITEHWKKIVAKTDQSRFSLTKCVLSNDKSRAVPLPPYSQLPEHRIKLYATYKEILQADVLSFYHTIYTHSIPWALHGKAVAKQNRNRHDPAVFGNALDFYVRQGQDGQTKGIPVGPDTSRIISEVILCAIEEILEQSPGVRIPAGIRYIDDIFFCFGSGASANDALSALRIAVQEFDLQLNDTKTVIYPALEYNEETWPSTISGRRIASGVKDQRKSLLSFFGLVIDVSKKTQTESIANYAVKLTTRVLIQRRNWDIYEAFLIRVARENTNTVDVVVKIFCTYASMGYALTDLVSQFVNAMVLEHSPLNHHYEVAWILWLAFSLRVRVARDATEALCRLQNPFCALLAFQLADQQLLDGPFDVSGWLSISGPDLYGTHWLLIYEGAVHGWLGAAARNVVSADPFFSVLLAEGISFFDLKAKNRPFKVAESEFLLQRQLGGKRSGRLPGNVFVRVRRGEPVEDDFESLGDEYGFDAIVDDFPDFDEDDDGP